MEAFFVLLFIIFLIIMFYFVYKKDEFTIENTDANDTEDNPPEITSSQTLLDQISKSLSPEVLLEQMAPAKKPVAKNKPAPKTKAKPPAKKPAAKKPVTKKNPAAKPASPGKPAAKKPAAKKPAAKRPTEKPVAKSPLKRAAKTHTSHTMDPAFVAILQRINAERGFSIFENFAKCKSLLQDYTAGEYKKENRLLLVAIEAGCPGEIARSTEPDITQKRLIDKLEDEFSMNQTAAEQIVAVLYEVYGS